jgi:hypothetical protein
MDMDYGQNATSGGTGRAIERATYEAKGLTDPPNESPSVIRDGVSYTEQTLSELHTVIDVLAKRLEMALSPVPPSTAAEGARGTGQSNQPVSHLAGRLMILNDGYQQAVGRLRELARRVEV